MHYTAWLITCVAVKITSFHLSLSLSLLPPPNGQCLVHTSHDIERHQFVTTNVYVCVNLHQEMTSQDNYYETSFVR